MNTTPSLPPARQPFSPQVVEALLLDTMPWLSCEDCFEKMDTYVDGLLADPAHEDPAMSRHLDGCAACDEEARSLLALLTNGL